MSKRKTHEEFVQEVNIKYNGKFSVIGKYIDAMTKIELQCNFCKTILHRIPNNILRRNCSCPICDSKLVTKTVTVGFNDLWTTRPDVASMLKNAEDGYLFREKSDKKTNFICPHCKNVVNKTISEVSEFGIRCNFCSRNYSYPNRLMTNLLNILNVTFTNEFIIHPYPYKYDFMFQLDQQKIIVEMDGSYGHGSIDTVYMTKEEQIETDKLKDKIALENGYQMIRIDCKYTSASKKFDYISNNIMKSNLNKLLSITNDDLLEADKSCQYSTLVQIASDWNNGITDYSYYYKKYHYDRHNIRYILTKCSELNMIKNSPDEIYWITKENAGKKISYTKGQPVMCNETGQVFHSIAMATKETGFQVGNYFNNKRKYKYAGELADGTKLTWTKISKEEYNKIINTRTS